MGGTAAGKGHMSTTYPAKVLKGDLEPAFMIDLAKKDLDIAIKFSESLGVPISLAIQAEKIYADAQSDGRGRQDWTAIFDMLQKNIFLKLLTKLFVGRAHKERLTHLALAHIAKHSSIYQWTYDRIFIFEEKFEKGFQIYYMREASRFNSKTSKLVQSKL